MENLPKELKAKIRRAKVARTALGLKQTYFQAFGVSKSQITHAETGRIQNFPFAYFYALILKGINPFWIETGQGDMYLEHPTSIAPISKEE